MLKRPSAKDSEEDLLRFQEEFLASKTKPAVTLVKKSDKRRSDDGSQQTSSQAQKDVVTLGGSGSSDTAAPPEKKVCFKETPSDGAEDDAEERLEKHDRHITKVLSEIVEKEFKNPTVYYPTALIEGGFPQVMHRGAMQQDVQTKGTKKKSLFAQHFQKGGAQKFGVKPKAAGQPLLDFVVEKNPLIQPQKSTKPGCVISGVGLSRQNPEKEAASIHEENLGQIAAMSEQEILHEQAQLLQMLDPSLVNFLRKRKQQQPVTEQGKDRVENVSGPKADEVQMSKMESNSSELGDSERKETTIESESTDLLESDLPVKPKKEWVHMNKIEYDKLEWTKSVAPPNTGDSKTGKPARFDFKGELVTEDSSIPVHLGLHHHGSDPDQAGYTLEEIYQLCRSANMQQRVMALNMLANIVHNARNGKFSECTSTFLIPALLDGGLTFVLRWALDDSTDNTMVAAVNLLHTLLVCSPDEEALDQTFHWYRGHQVPGLRSQVPETENELPQIGEEEPKQETDADVVKKDVIQGLLRMSLLPRLRFILTSWRPGATVVIQILEVLTRIARHSTQAAYQITQCQGLLEIIFKEFLPHHWTPVTPGAGPLSTVYGFPVPQALKLIRVICAAGRNLAVGVISAYAVMSCVTRYICDTAASLQLHLDQGLALYVEAYRMWQVCTSYGLATAPYYEDMYAVLVARIQALHSTKMISEKDENQLINDAILTLLESITQVAACVTIETAKQKTSQSKSLSSGDSNVTKAMPNIDWRQVQGFYQPIKNYSEKGLKEYNERYFEERYDLTCLSCALNYIGSYLSQIESQPGYNAVDTLTELEDFCDKHLVPCIKSQAFSLTLRLLRENSVLLCQTKGKRGETTPNLPELGALIGDKAEKCSVLNDSSTVAFLVAFTRVVLTVGRIHKDLITKLFPVILQNEETLQYVRKLCLWQKKAPQSMNYFSKFENILQHNLLTMARLSTDQNIDTKLYHQMALYLLIHLHQGDEYYAHSLFSTILFNAEFLKDISCDEDPSLAYLDEALRLHEEKYLTSATSETVKKGRVDLIKDSCENLVSVRNSYLKVTGGLIGAMVKSRNRALPNPLDIDKLQTGDVDQLLVPVDWPFLPLVELYNSMVARQSQGDKTKEIPKSEIESLVINTLRWVYVLELWRPGVLDSVSLTLKLSRLYCVFLAENDLFLNSSIHGYLLSLLKSYCRPGYLSRLNLEEKVPGLASFYDLYIQLLTHFEAVSFGDPLFAGYVLLPQQQTHATKYRSALWGEQATALMALTLPLNQVVIPLESFLEPEETNLELLRLYFQALVAQSVTPQRTPLPYLIAVHHVNRFLYTQDNKHKTLKEAFIKQTDRCRNQILRKHLFYYKKHTVEAQYGLELYNELPANRKSLLQSHGVKEQE